MGGLEGVLQSQPSPRGLNPPHAPREPAGWAVAPLPEAQPASSSRGGRGRP